MQWLYAAAREQGKYEAIGGHKARSSGAIDPSTNREVCAVCRRPLTWRGDKHAATRRKKVQKGT